MKKKIIGIPLIDFALVLALALVAIIVGTFKDLQISESLAHVGNYFGKIFAIVGKYPGYLLLGSSGILFYVYKKNDAEKGSKAWAYAFLVALPLVAGALYGYDDIQEFITNKIAAILVGVLAIAVGEIGLYFLFRNADKEEAYNAGMCFLFSAVLVFVTTYLLKNAALRPRYSWLVSSGDLTNYRTWYAFDSSVREANSTVDSSSFMSWPSSHVAMASVASLSVLFPRLNKKLAGKEWLFFLAAVIWSVIVAAARVSDGSHFLSDVGWGALIGTGFPLLVASLVYPGANEKKETAYPAAQPIETTRATAAAPIVEPKQAEPRPVETPNTTSIVAPAPAEPAKPIASEPPAKPKDKKKKKDDFFEIDS